MFVVLPWQFTVCIKKRNPSRCKIIRTCSILQLEIQFLREAAAADAADATDAADGDDDGSGDGNGEGDCSGVQSI